MASDMLDHALKYVAEGFAVFPVGKDKKPITAHGFKDATQTQQGVKEFWTKYPDAGIAIPTEGLIVVDIDANHGGFESLGKLQEKYGELPKTRLHTTGSGGQHYIYRNPNGTNIRNKAGLAGYSGIDIRANGGYIVMPPSLHPSGNRYDLTEDIPISDAPKWIVELTKEKTPIVANTTAGKIPQGQNDQWLYKRASTYRGQGDTEDIIFEKLKIDSRRLDQDTTYPYTDKDFRRIAKSACLHDPNEEPLHGKSTLSMSRLSQWLSLADGNFNVKQIWAELNIVNPSDKNILRVYLRRLTDSGVIAKTKTDGTYRKIDNEKQIIEWEKADPNAYLPIWLPFGLHNLCKVFPKSIIVVAGSKNAGKTAFLTDCIMPNIEQAGMILDFINSESGAEQLNERFTALKIPTPPPFITYSRYDNFADIIEPDHISIIDYLDMNAETYLVGDEIDKIFRKLTTGCAIIGIQKPPPTVTFIKGVRKVVDRDLGYGGGFSAKRAVVYISLSTAGQHSGRAKLVYCKTPFQKNINPNNMMWSYDFDENGYFTNVQRYYPQNQLGYDE